MSNIIMAAKGQTLEDHVNLMLKCWEIRRRRYERALRRLISSIGIDLDLNQIDDFMKVLIILHDVGKASGIYQRYLREKEELEGFRHEFISAYYTFKAISEGDKIFGRKLAEVGALIVMMHHEPILMGQIIRLEKKELSAEVVIDKLRKFDGVLPELNHWLREKLSSISHIGVVVPKDPVYEEILDVVYKLSVRARHMPDAPKLRMVVAGFLIPLVLCDYEGARGREGDPPAFRKVLEVESWPCIA